MLVKREEKNGEILNLYSSSNIVASAYNKYNNDLTVTFKNGGRYTYRNVANNDYNRFELAESQGKVFESHIN